MTCQDVSHAGHRAGLIRQRIPAGVQACGCMWADHNPETCDQATAKGVVPSRTTDKRKRAAAIQSLNARDKRNPQWNRPEQEETRSGLWGQMLRAVDQLRPRLVVAENVRGLLSAKADSDVEPCPWCLGDGGDEPRMRALGAVLADLADIGYDAAWYGLRAADVGAAHGRFRVFIFAWPAADAEGDEGWLGNGDSHPPADADDAGRGEHGWPVPVRAEQPAAEHARPDTAGLTLLPTPRTSDTNGAGRHGNGGPDLRTVVNLLPTPTAQDSAASGGSTPSDVTLTDAVVRTDMGRRPNPRHLLPTPTTEPLTGNGHARHLGGEVNPARWGEYADAIAHWAPIVGRPAPEPTEPGPKGSPRLSPTFVEWLMGLPAGWVTDPAIGLTRNQQLKALGNGVVPQQAAAATAALLDDMRAGVLAA